MFENEKDNPLYWRDEILQIMFWMTNEGFGREFSATDLRKFFEADDSVLTENLEKLVFAGFAERVAENRFALTALGKSEGGRRFVDEFEELMKPGHFECSEPDCDCHDPDSSGEGCKHLLQPDSVN